MNVMRTFPCIIYSRCHSHQDIALKFNFETVSTHDNESLRLKTMIYSEYIDQAGSIYTCN